jgi:acyl carrier protein
VTDQIREQIRQFILANYLVGESPQNLKDDTPLMTGHLLDSMATLGLVAFIEKEYGIELEAHDVGVEHFDRIADIADLVTRKRAG